MMLAYSTSSIASNISGLDSPISSTDLIDIYGVILYLAATAIKFYSLIILWKKSELMKSFDLYSKEHNFVVPYKKNKKSILRVAAVSTE